jgi:hypothetical protein
MAAGDPQAAPLTRRRRLCLGAQISPAGLAWLGRISGLTQLELARCVRLSDAGVRHLANLERLGRLGLARCEHITGAGFDAFTGSTCLQVRALAAWRRGGVAAWRPGGLVGAGGLGGWGAGWGLVGWQAAALRLAGSETAAWALVLARHIHATLAGHDCTLPESC